MSSVEEQLRNYYESLECSTDSDEYQQSLDIFLTLRSLLALNQIDATDIAIVESVISGYSFRKTAQVLRIDRRTVTTRYRRVVKLLEEAL
jgi:hypothetical protein